MNNKIILKVIACGFIYYRMLYQMWPKWSILETYSKLKALEPYWFKGEGNNCKTLIRFWSLFINANSKCLELKSKKKRTKKFIKSFTYFVYTQSMSIVHESNITARYFQKREPKQLLLPFVPSCRDEDR